jgi:Ca-activated chloride channel family protein
MKGIGIILILVASLIDPTKIGKINSLKAEAKDAYLTGNFKTAVQKYKYLVDSLHVQEDEVLLNLANAYFQLNDTTNATGHYQSLTRSSKNTIRSKAQQQLGVMSNRNGKFEEALNHFKESIKSDPTNEDARYNYEMLKKKLEEQKKQEQQNKDQKQDEKKDQQKDKQDKKNEEQKKEQEKKEQEKKEQEKKDQEKKDQEQQKKDQEKKDQEKNKEEKEEKKEMQPSKPEQMKMSEEKAKMILEAMKNQEKQYLQQNKRKATKRKDKGKPDW